MPVQIGQCHSTYRALTHKLDKYAGTLFSFFLIFFTLITLPLEPAAWTSRLVHVRAIPKVRASIHLAVRRVSSACVCESRITIKLKRTKQKSIYLFIVLVIVCVLGVRWSLRVLLFGVFDYAMFILICCTWTSKQSPVCKYEGKHTAKGQRIGKFRVMRAR